MSVRCAAESVGERLPLRAEGDDPLLEIGAQDGGVADDGDDAVHRGRGRGRRPAPRARTGVPAAPAMTIASAVRTATVAGHATEYPGARLPGPVSAAPACPASARPAAPRSAPRSADAT